MFASAESRRQDMERRYPVWPRVTLGQHFRERALEYADRPLLLMPDNAYSYKEMWEAACRVAKSMLALGVKRRDHVALLMANEPEYIMAKLAVAMVGAICVPVNTMLREDELDYMLRQSDSQYLFMHQVAAGANHEAAIKRVILEPRESDLTLQLKQVVCIQNTDNAVDDTFMDWSRFCGLAGKVSDEQLETVLTTEQYPDEVCDIIYTSGTTGSPKGVMLTHEHILRCGFSTALSRAFEDGRRTFTPLPMYHVFAYVEGLSALSFVGGALISMPAFVPKVALKLIEQYKATDLLCVPSILIAILNHPDRDKYDLSSLSALMCAAAPAPVPVWQEAVTAFGLDELCAGYGGTEATAATAHTEIGDSIETMTTRVGRIKPGGSSGLPEFGGRNVQYKVVDPFTGQDLKEGSVGELTVRGNLVTHGYYKKPDETAAVIDKDGWLRTGDLGRLDENGYIEFLGRSKEMYKVSGENVSPKEIEEVITRHPAVKQAYVVGVADSITTEAGAAFVELREGQSATRRELINWCQERLAKYKMPRHFWFVEETDWPMTGTGKIQKFHLQALAREKLKQTESN